MTCYVYDLVPRDDEYRAVKDELFVSFVVDVDTFLLQQASRTHLIKFEWVRRPYFLQKTRGSSSHDLLTDLTV